MRLFHRIPDIAFADRMKEKSNGIVLAVDLQDPNTTHGMVEVLKNYNHYTPAISECGNVRKKMVVNGKIRN